MKNCDTCGKNIENDEGNSSSLKDPIFQALEFFHDTNEFALTEDSNRLGCAAVFFRGDYKDCMIIQEFIHSIKDH